jgi:hypothetical protein
MPRQSRGARLRKEIDAEYDIQGVAAETLVDAICDTADELEAFEQALASEGPLITGARGQKVANPAVAGIVRHRALLARLLQQAFPQEHETTTERAKRAAKARWQKEKKT